MQRARFRFYAELNDLLPQPKRRQCFSHAFEAVVSVKDIVEAFGIPHTEVDLILANGETVTFSYLLRDGDRISVYPVFRSIDLSPLTCLQPRSGAEIVSCSTHTSASSQPISECSDSTAYIATTVATRNSRISPQTSSGVS